MMKAIEQGLTNIFVWALTMVIEGKRMDDELNDNIGGGCLLVGFVLAVTVLVIITYVCHPYVDPEVHRIDNIEQIMMHTTYQYTFLQRSGDELKMIKFKGCSPKIVCDVPEGQLCYATYQLQKNKIDKDTKINLVLHLHSARDMSGGDWDYGKFGRGKTNVLH